jgi:hypothetical protein
MNIDLIPIRFKPGQCPTCRNKTALDKSHANILMSKNRCQYYSPDFSFMNITTSQLKVIKETSGSSTTTDGAKQQ